MENPLLKLVLFRPEMDLRTSDHSSMMYASKANRHRMVDTVDLQKRRKKNKVARRSRRINQLTRKH